MMGLLGFSQAWSLVHVAVVFLLLFRSKYSLRRTCITIFIICTALLTAALTLLAFWGWAAVARVALITCSIPSMILFCLLSEYRDGRFFFTFCLSDTCCIWIMQVTALLDRLCGETYIVLFISRLLLFPLFELLLWKKLRRPYLELQANLTSGWWMITVISAVFYLLLMAVNVPVDIPIASYSQLIVLLLVLALMPITYIAILFSLRRQMLYYESQNKQNLLAAQVSGLEGRIAATRTAEETIRIEKHDLRHKLLNVEDMLARGENDEALAYIHTLQGDVAYTKPERWCADPLLDAVFSSYFAQAEQQGIRVKAKLSLPEQLPVPSAELSTVFANALENAIHACAELPPEQREIVCTCISQPALMFEIANPYSGTIHFDEAGLPISQDMAHGIGTRSIAAFCEQHDACCVYETKGGWFHLRVAL